MEIEVKNRPKSGIIIIISIIAIVITVIAIVSFAWFMIGAKEELVAAFFTPNDAGEFALLPFSILFGFTYIIFLGGIVIVSDIVSIVLGIIGIVLNTREKNKSWLTTSIICTVISGLIFLVIAVNVAITALGN